MNKPRPKQILADSGHEEAFAQRYNTLMGWALRFTNQDREQAEDLVHDAFVQFMISQTDLSAIESVDGYLYAMLRNLHVSQVRRAVRIRETAYASEDILSISDTASVYSELRAAGQRLQIQDELCRICQYAAVRKHSSKIGSTVILRFFLGYYPNEIVSVTRTSRASVDKMLQRARAEARLYLKDPNSLSFIKPSLAPPDLQIKFGQEPEDLLRTLRDALYRSRSGECPQPAKIREIYQSKQTDDLTPETLAHIVCCPVCLDEVNLQLDLPPLASREPEKMTGRDNRDKNERGGNSGDGSGTTGDFMEKPRRRLKEVLDHRPKELRFSVNGFILSSHTINSELNKLSLVAKGEERIGFVEVFSEEEVRLLFCVVEPPPDGPVEQTVTARLSNDRTLELLLDFSDSWPSLNLTYRDPAFSSQPQANEELSVPTAVATKSEEPTLPKEGWLSRLFTRLDLLQPARFTAVVSLLIIAIFGYWFINQPPKVERATARAVLTEARNVEYTLAAAPDKALHRNYQIEEWSNGNLRSRQRIDEWQKQKAIARRTYDDQGRMIAGEWQNEDTRRVFQQGERLKSVPSAKADGVFDFADIAPSASAFAGLLDQYDVASMAKLDQSPTTFTFHYTDDPAQPMPLANINGGPSKLLVASLSLDRNTMLPTAESIVLQIGDETREYRFSDVRVEQKPIAEISPAVFEPEPELAKGAIKVTKPALPEPGAVATGVNAPTANTTAPAATLDTEVEVMRALDSINALSGDQISVTRTAAGQLKIVGIVDSPARKQEILNALGGVKGQPGVVIDVQTAAEAASRIRPSGTVTPIEVDSSSAVATRKFPAETELRAYFERRGTSGGAIDSEVAGYARNVINRSDSLRRNALALKRLAERFSPAELERLDPTNRDQWKSLLRSKAAAVAGDARSLEAQLSAAGFSVGGETGGGQTIRNASDVAQAAQRLFGLGVECDTQVQESFSVAQRSSGTTSVKTVQFWRNLSQISAIATEIQKF